MSSNNSSLKDYFGCAVLIIIGLAAIYVWQKYLPTEWIVAIAGGVMIVFGIIAGIRLR